MGTIAQYLFPHCLCHKFTKYTRSRGLVVSGMRRWLVEERLCSTDKFTQIVILYTYFLLLMCIPLGRILEVRAVSKQVTQDNKDCYTPTGSVVMSMHKHNRQTTLLYCPHSPHRGVQCESAIIQPCYVYGVYWGFHFVSIKLQTFTHTFL